MKEMIDFSNIPVRELFNSLNGGILFCLEHLANWLAQDGLEVVLYSLDEAYDAAKTKRERECLFFLIDGISSIEVESLGHHIGQIKELLPALTRSNELYNVKVERTGRTLDEWKAAAEHFKTLLNNWGRWIGESERLQVEEFRGGIRQCIMTRYSRAFLFDPAFDSPLKLGLDRDYFIRKVAAVTKGIEQGHLSNKLPKHLEVRDFYRAKETLMALQSEYESQVVVDASTREQDDALWSRYHERLHLLVRLLATMGEAQLWSVFWLCHPEEVDRPAN